MANILLCLSRPVGHRSGLLGPNPLPPWKVTSSSSTSGSLPHAGVLQWPRVDPWGTHSTPYVLPPAGGLPSTAVIGHYQGP